MKYKIERDILLKMDKMKVKYGKNAAENWRIYEVADEEDMWFHVDDEPSAHVILEDPYTTFRAPSCRTARKVAALLLEESSYMCEEEAFNACARLCVERTPKLRERENVKVIYTKIGNLKKGKCVGELIIQNMDLVKSINVKKDKMEKKNSNVNK